MSIRSTAKAIIIDSGKVLLNKNIDENGKVYYSLPGGGQHDGESLTDAVIRECLEETGYTVRPIRFAALCELICTDKELVSQYPSYAHKIYHIFICELSGHEQKAPTERDHTQVGSEWIEIGSLNSIYLCPRLFGENIDKVLDGSAPVFLGTEYIDRVYA